MTMNAKEREVLDLVGNIQDLESNLGNFSQIAMMHNQLLVHSEDYRTVMARIGCQIGVLVPNDPVIIGGCVWDANPELLGKRLVNNDSGDFERSLLSTICQGYDPSPSFISADPGNDAPQVTIPLQARYVRCDQREWRLVKLCLTTFLVIRGKTPVEIFGSPALEATMKPGSTLIIPDFELKENDKEDKNEEERQREG